MTEVTEPVPQVDVKVKAPKKELVKQTLLDSQWWHCSDRSIADHLGVSAAFVSQIRRKLVAAGEIDAHSERIDRLGRRLETENIGAKPKPAPPLEQEIRCRIHNLTTEEKRKLYSWLGELIQGEEDF